MKIFKLISIFILFFIQINFIKSDEDDSKINENKNGTQTDDFFNGELGKKLRLIPLTNSINDFGMKLISELNKENKNTTTNLAFSPLSIGQIFSMIISSAHNQTLEELMNVFGFDDQLQTSENVNNAFKILLDDYEKTQLESSKRPIKLSIPSIALYSNDFNIKKSFRANLKENYKADAKKIDFSSPATLKTINDFVNENTNGQIPKLIEKLNSENKLALVNAFYFKGDWANQFDKNFVKERQFFNADKTTTNTKLMFKRDRYDYFEDDNLQAISLPYLGNVSMTILLPQKNKSIDDLINNLNNSIIDYYRYQMQTRQVELYLPKLKIESSIDLKDPISNLGAFRVFSAQADLSGITSYSNVFVSEAVHKAFLEINEQGTEAAAATGVGIQTKSFSTGMKKMTIDHPFVFLIHDHLNNLLLFMGAIKKL